MKAKVRNILIGIALGLSVSGSWQPALVIIGLLLLVHVVEIVIPKPRPVRSAGPKIIHLFVP